MLVSKHVVKAGWEADRQPVTIVNFVNYRSFWWSLPTFGNVIHLGQRRFTSSQTRWMPSSWQVYLDVFAVEKEKTRLDKENGQLRGILKQVLDGVSVNDEVLQQANPLLVVNGKVRRSTLVGEGVRVWRARRASAAGFWVVLQCALVFLESGLVQWSLYGSLVRAT